MDVTIQKEYLDREASEEMWPVVIRHGHELGLDIDEMAMDWPTYLALQENGLFHYYTLRRGGRLAGYVTYFITPSMHRVGTSFALCDMFYIEPQSRGMMQGARMLSFAEEDLKKYGILSIWQGVRADHDYSKLLLRKGYHLDEYCYIKRVQ